MTNQIVSENKTKKRNIHQIKIPFLFIEVDIKIIVQIKITDPVLNLEIVVMLVRCTIKYEIIKIDNWCNTRLELLIFKICLGNENKRDINNSSQISKYINLHIKKSKREISKILRILNKLSRWRNSSLSAQHLK